MNPLKQLEQYGQSPWLDFVRRSLIGKGELAEMVERDGLKGVTSNPSIFEKAIGHSDEYTDDVKQFQQGEDHGVSALYEHLAIADIRAGADVLKKVYDETNGRDGYISLEVSPYLANDTDATIAEARRLWQTVDRPNLMVKVPATPAGVPAIRTLIGEGININVTLLFAISAYEAVVEAYIGGLEKLVQSGGDPARIASVASFFVSRIDALAEKKLAAKGGDHPGLVGTVAIANAKIAYVRYKEMFSGARWEALAQRGARTQRLLWASTSTKSKTLPDTLYIDRLIGRDTVNTIPPATMDAFRDHGTAAADTVEADLPGARATLKALADAGVSLDEVTRELVEDGVKQFADAFDQLLGSVAMRRRTLFEGDRATLSIKMGEAMQGAYDAELEAWRRDGRIRKLWAGDKSLWTGADEDKWTGWLHIVGHELAGIGELEKFADHARGGGYSDVVLLGMGGSSLGPEVLSETFGHRTGFPKFHMLDSTDPAQVKHVADSVDLARSLFIVSSKSGSTLEPNIYMAYFMDRVRDELGDNAAKHFVAVTDPGSALEKHAGELGMQVFHGVKSIGGRYSVLSAFGLVPAAAIGIDLRAFLETTQQMVRSCADDVPPAENPGVQLGVAIGVAAKQFGRDKVTIVASPGIGDLGAWLEQLIAESTGKQGHGLIPVDSEPLASPDKYSDDRFFAYLELAGEPDLAQKSAVDALEKAGHPVARIMVKTKMHIGQEFFRWEIATAVAGSVIGINPFDQPDVEASKVKTRGLTDEYEKTGKLHEDVPIFDQGGVKLFADAANAGKLGRHDDLAGYLRALFAEAKPHDYVALLAYIQRDAAHLEAMRALRTTIRDRTRMATCVGFGPRFLHSTGQAYKGGKNSGVFLQITCDDPADIAVPGQKYTFGVVKAAQAQGDLGVLTERRRRALRVHLHDVESGLAMLARAVGQSLS